MKKERILAGLTALTAAFSICCGCEKKNSSSTDGLSNYSLDVDGEKQPDPLAPLDDGSNNNGSALQENNSTPAANSGNDSEQTTEATLKAGNFDAETTTKQQRDPLGEGEFKYDDNGAVLFSDSKEESDDDVKISAAQALFQSACRTEWAFKFGCPYQMDTSDVIKNEFGWEFAKITDPAITSIADVQRDYCRVFSERYVTGLTDVYKEKDGAVYALAPERGSNRYYSVSKITGIKATEGDEIVFNVENYYNGNDFDANKPYSETAEFSVVVSSDGKWRVGRFILPY